MNIGVLAFQGDVDEHIKATKQASKNIHIPLSVRAVRTKEQLVGLHGLIIPGGESTVLFKLTSREGMFEEMKSLPAIMGTCAGAIMLAKKISHKEKGQKTLERMDIEVDRNAYGRQSESFETTVETTFGNIPGVFIRAPKILKMEKNVHSIVSYKGEIIGCEQIVDNRYYLALTFHPELVTSKFHEYFLTKVHSIVNV